MKTGKDVEQRAAGWPGSSSLRQRMTRIEKTQRHSFIKFKDRSRESSNRRISNMRDEIADDQARMKKE
jgi:hypothetical protein